MNKHIFASLFVLCCAAFLVAFVPLTSKINWKQTSIEFGKITQNKPVTATYEFVNQSNEPIFIQDAKGSCGCTGVEYPKTAIQAGKAGTISATFNAAKVGAFHKTVSVYTNADANPVILHFNGEVIAE